MRRLTLVIVSALLALATPTAGGPAKRFARDCLVIKVRCLDTVRSGEDATFSAVIDNPSTSTKLTYNWVVSAGTIRSGQGTASIVVDTTGLPNVTLEATVEVQGLPDSCARSASCSTAVPGRIGYHDKVDEYGNIKFEDEQARLDNFAVELQNWPEGIGYIIAYGGRRSHPGEARKRMERAKRYLTSVRNIPVRQVITIDGGYRETLTVELWLRQQDLPPPQPMPTVDPKEVQIIKATKPKGRRRH